jgi:aminoglycoside phosphotransferase
VTIPAGLAAILEAACAQARLPALGAEVIRLGENAIFRLHGGVVARITRIGQQAAARREIAVSRWLNASGVAAVAAWGDIEQPIEVNSRSVTFWDELPPHAPGSLPQVAAVLRQLHALPVPACVPLGALDPFVRLRERIGQATTLPESDRAWLTARLAGLQQEWAALSTAIPACVVHGDAWTGNVAATRDGRVILLDLERCSVGPPEWDLVSTAVKHVTFGQVSPAGYRQFCDAYGRDVTNWNGFPLLRNIRELRVTCYAAQQAAEHSQFAGEASLRVACLQGRRGPRPWPWTPVLGGAAEPGAMFLHHLPAPVCHARYGCPDRPGPRLGRRPRSRRRAVTRVRNSLSTV